MGHKGENNLEMEGDVGGITAMIERDVRNRVGCKGMGGGKNSSK